MKRIGLSTAIALISAMFAAASGHAGQTLLERAIQASAEVKSYRTDFQSSVSMTMTMMGQSLPMDATTRGTSEYTREPLRTKSDITSSGGGQATHAVAYAEKAGDGFAVYSKMDGGGWTKMTLGGNMLNSMTGAPDLGQFLKLAADFQMCGTETVRGAEATVYAGALTPADLKGVIDMGAVTGAITSAMGMDLGELDWNAFGAIPMTVSVCNETAMPVKFTMDMTAFMKKLGPIILERAIEAVRARAGSADFDPAKLGFRIDFGKTCGEAVFYDYDAVDPVEIPAAARSAQAIPLFKPTDK